MEIEDLDVVELEGDRFITLEESREWPKYRMAWTLRERVGDTTFPLASGSVERMPPGDGDVDNMLADLREGALAQARQASETTSGSASPTKKSGSFLKRLFGRV